MTNYPGLQKSLLYSLKQAFAKLQSEQATDSIDGVALFLFSGAFAGIEAEPFIPAPRFGMSFNTKENLESFNQPANDLAYMRWTPGRWDYRDVYPESFKTINRVLMELTSFGAPLLRDQLHLISINALLEARMEYPALQHAIFTFAYSDSLSQDDVAWIAKLNTEKDATEFQEMIKRF